MLHIPGLASRALVNDKTQRINLDSLRPLRRGVMQLVLQVNYPYSSLPVTTSAAPPMPTMLAMISTGLRSARP